VVALDDSPTDQAKPNQADAPDNGEEGGSEPTDRSPPEPRQMTPKTAAA